MEDWKTVATTADRLREAMQAADKKQTDLVEATGLNKSTISRYLSGAMAPKSKAIGLLSRALNVSEMWLWGYDVPMSRTPEQKKSDAMISVVAKMRKDPEFFNVVSMLADLPAEQYASIKQLISALGNK